MSRQNRREFLQLISALAALAGAPDAIAGETPPEIATIRLAKNPNICVAPFYVAEELLRAEGFTDIRYSAEVSGLAQTEMVVKGEIDFASLFAGTLVYQLDAGLPIVALGGLHVGCYELFAHEPVRTISDLKGRRLGIQDIASSGHLYLSIIAAHVGIDPAKDIEWVKGGKAMIRMFAEGKVDAVLAFPPEPQELRARNLGRAILKTTTDRPWSNYFCCLPYTSRDFATRYPVATKRALRALIKAADICAGDPARAARILIDGKYTGNYDYALQALSDIPYRAWRDYDVADTMRFYALRLREVGMIKSNPNKLIAGGTEPRFFEELKRELKA